MLPVALIAALALVGYGLAGALGAGIGILLAVGFLAYANAPRRHRW